METKIWTSDSRSCKKQPKKKQQRRRSIGNENCLTYLLTLTGILSTEEP